MAAKRTDTIIFDSWIERSIDCAVTLICWAWFLLGFLLFFSWRYFGGALFSKNTELRFQQLNSQFYRILFKILKVTAPSQAIVVDKEVQAIRSAVIVCNHLSYLDPLLLIATFPKQKTIVKSRFFEMPIFGNIITRAGYLPDSGEGRFSAMMIVQLETMSQYLKDGGNLFIFPEGTRSRDGSLGRLNRGALKIARLCEAPIYVLQVQNTDKLFTPGKFLFNTRRENKITLKIRERIIPDYRNNPPSTAQLEEYVHRAFAGKLS